MCCEAKNKNKEIHSCVNNNEKLEDLIPGLFLEAETLVPAPVDSEHSTCLCC